MSASQNLQIRNLGAVGVVTDAAADSVDIRAFTRGSNVRFQNNEVRRAPVFREIEPLTGQLPRAAIGVSGSGTQDSIIYATATGQLYVRSPGGSTTEATASGYTPATTEAPWTAQLFSSVVYFNRASDLPYALLPGASQFVPLANWDAGWRCASLRSFMDYMVALNVSKSGVQQTNLVKWSDLTLQGQMPGSWDSTDATTSAGENPLTDATTPLVDGLALTNRFIIYSEQETYLMQYVGGAELFSLARILAPGQGGILNVSCAVEVMGRHYVFGPTDIYAHDGTGARQSISVGFVNDYIYANINTQRSGQFFVQHNPALHEIMFCYVSGDADCYWKQPSAATGDLLCNKAAVFNYENSTWTFYDLPNVGAMCLSNLQPVLTWDTLGARTWQGMGGSWNDLQPGYQRHVCAFASNYTNPETAQTIDAPRLLGLDPMDQGSLPYQYDPQCNAPVSLQHTNIDLSQNSEPIQTFKQVLEIEPQVELFRDIPVMVQIGANQYRSQQPTYEAPVSFDPSRDYKVDSRANGRYLAIQWTVAEPADFRISGFDVRYRESARR